MLKIGDQVALVVNSNGLQEEETAVIEELKSCLEAMGLKPVMSHYLFRKRYANSGTAQERGTELMRFYTDATIKGIFDISGGDLANEVLPYIDYDVIRDNPKPFFGYSDLTTVINAIYQKSAVPTYLFQLKTLLWDESKRQVERFRKSLLDNQEELFDVNWKIQQGEVITGELVGGNIRCLLKLAGTPYFPNLQGKVLFLESSGGGVPQITTYLTQLKQLGAFNQISGLLLGTFTALEQELESVGVLALLEQVCPNLNLPLGVTTEVGHGKQSKALKIGREIYIKKGKMNYL